MSRIGKAPIELPKGVKVDIKGDTVTVTGPKGSLTQSFQPDMAITMEDGVLTVNRPTDSQEHRSLHGLTRALLNNMVVGVNEGFSKVLRIEGVGYRSELEGKTLILSVGYSHPVTFESDLGVDYEVEERGRKVTVSGIDKQVVGEIAARIRKTRPPEPYKGKGIRYEGEYVRRKAGKAGKV